MAEPGAIGAEPPGCNPVRCGCRSRGGLGPRRRQGGQAERKYGGHDAALQSNTDSFHVSCSLKVLIDAGGCLEDILAEVGVCRRGCALQ